MGTWSAPPSAVNLVDAVVEVYRDPGQAADAAHGWTYRSAEILGPPAGVSPLAAPAARIAVADLANLSRLEPVLSS